MQRRQPDEKQVRRLINLISAARNRTVMIGREPAPDSPPEFGPPWEDPNVLYLASRVYVNLWNSAYALLAAKAPNSYRARLIQAEALEAQERFAEAAHEYAKF